jgi:hypothetical protein
MDVICKKNRHFRNLSDAEKCAQRHGGCAECVGEGKMYPPLDPPPLPPNPEDILLIRLFVSPKSVRLGGYINVSVIAINKSKNTASKTVTMTGDFAGSKPITLKSGARGITRFTIKPSIIGDFNVSIDGLSGSFSVIAPLTIVERPLREVLLFLLILFLFAAIVVAPIVIFGIMHGHK